MTLLFVFVLTSALMLTNARPQEAVVMNDDDAAYFHEAVLEFVEELIKTLDVYFRPVLEELEKIDPESFKDIYTDDPYGHDAFEYPGSHIDFPEHDDEHAAIYSYAIAEDEYVDESENEEGDKKTAEIISVPDCSTQF